MFKPTTKDPANLCTQVAEYCMSRQLQSVHAALDARHYSRMTWAEDSCGWAQLSWEASTFANAIHLVTDAKLKAMLARLDEQQLSSAILITKLDATELEDQTLEDERRGSR